MGSLWQFFGLPDPEGNTNAPPPRAAPTEQSHTPVSLSSGSEPEAAEPSALAAEPVATRPVDERTVDLSGLKAPPMGWTGPLTPDGEAFHDLGCLLYTSPSPRD